MTPDDASISVQLTGRLGAFALDAACRMPMRGITALFGPSGCGKTTILRCLAGLLRLPGRLAVGDQLWQDSESGIFVPTYRRHVGFVFQEASLFPHLSVRGNLLYGACRKGGAPTPAGFDLDGVVDLLGISHLLDRSPVALSGGERQRVAVGRALLSAPRVLLMDEPLSAVDRITKEDIIPYFEKLHEALSIPIIYVSHDLTEIERLADTLVLMNGGRIVASGPLDALQTNPDLPLFSAPDATVVIEGRVAEVDVAFGLTRLAVSGGTLLVAGRHGDIGAKRRLRIPASDVSLARSAPTDSTILNCLPARILTIDDRADNPQASVLLGIGPGGTGDRLLARITRKSLANLGLAPGQIVYAQIKGVAVLTIKAGRS